MAEKTKTQPDDQDRNWSEAAAVASDTLDEWDEVIDFIQRAEGADGARFSQTDNISGTNISLPDLDKRIRSILGLISGVVEPEPWAPIPSNFISELKQPVSEIRQQVATCKSAIRSIDAAGGVGALTPHNWVLIPKQGGQQHNFASPLQTIQQRLDNAAMTFWRLGPAIDQTALPYYEGAISTLSDLMSEARENAKRAEDYARGAKADAEAAKAECDQVQKDGRDIAEMLESASEKRTTISEYEQQCLNGWNKIDEIVGRANEIDPKIAAAKQQLADLDKEIEQRTAKLDLKIDEADALEKRLKELRSTTSDLAEQARGMLNMSIKAGLAASFSAAVEKLDDRVFWAKIAFYASIAVLGIFTIPLALYLFSDIAAELGIKLFAGEEIKITKVIALVVLTLPWVWLARFSGQQYDALFHLREHYQHKLSLAASVDTFREQAKEYSDAITAETFYQLTVNPAEKLGKVKESGRHPSPVMNWLMDRIVGDKRFLREGSELKDEAAEK